MTDIQWTEPPAKNESREKWSEVRAALKARPRQWARIIEGKNISKATAWRRGAAGWDVGDWEFRQVQIPDTSIGDLYARYIGGGAQ